MSDRLSPLNLLSSDLARVREGSMPQISVEDLLRSMKLDGPYPDGLTLMERVLDLDTNLSILQIIGSIAIGFNKLREVQVLAGDIEDVLTHMAKEESTPQEEALAVNLSKVAVKQIVREGDICPMGTKLCLDLSVIRPKLIPPNVSAILVDKVIRETGSNMNRGTIRIGIRRRKPR